MNKKMLVTTLTVLTLVLLTTASLGTVQAKSKKCCETQELNVKLFNAVQQIVWEKAHPSSADLATEDGVYTDPTLEYVRMKSTFPVVDASSAGEVIITIGTQVFSTKNDEISFTGDIWNKIYNPTDGENDYSKYVIKWRIDFNPATTGIDGSIIFNAKGYNSRLNTPTSDELMTTIEDHGIGYGTGDLKGVKTWDTGTLMVDFAQPTPVWIEHQGKIKCWPDINFFKMVISGGADTETGHQWVTPQPPKEAEAVHTRNREWVIGDVLTLTVGSDTWAMGGSPINLSYQGTFDSDLKITEDGNFTKVRVDETYSIFYMDKKIGSLKLYVRSEITPTGAGGKVWGYGTGYFRGVKIKAADVVNIIPGDPPIYELARVGKIFKWPGLPT